MHGWHKNNKLIAIYIYVQINMYIYIYVVYNYVGMNNYATSK